MTKIKLSLNKAFGRWFQRKATIKSIIAQATDNQKQEIIADYELVKRLSSYLSHSEMQQVLSHLNAPLVLRLKLMLRWSGYGAQVISLIEKSTDDEKQEIADDIAILTHIMITYRDDYKQRIIHHLNLLAAQMFTNHPNNDDIGLTSLLVLSQNKLTISKEVNFVPKGTFRHDKAGFESLKARMIAATTNKLSHKYKVKIESVHEEQEADGQYPIIVKLSHNPDADYQLILYGGTYGHGGLTKVTGHIYEFGVEDKTFVPSVYLAHEAAHLILGADEEYAVYWLPRRAVYTDNSLMGNFYLEGIEEAEIKARHFLFIVSLLQDWFPERVISIK